MIEFVILLITTIVFMYLYVQCLAQNEYYTDASFDKIALNRYRDKFKDNSHMSVADHILMTSLYGYDELPMDSGFINKTL